VHTTPKTIIAPITLAADSLDAAAVAARLGQFVGALGTAVRARTLLTWRPVGAALVAAAGEEGADLVAVPIRREGELTHLFDDHADRYVLHHSAVLVLVVPTNPDRLEDAA
jgi:hypothetical protein